MEYMSRDVHAKPHDAVAGDQASKSCVLRPLRPGLSRITLPSRSSIRIDPFRPMKVLCFALRYRRNEGRLGMVRRLSSWGGYMRPSSFQSPGLYSIPECLSSTAFRFSTSSASAWSAELAAFAADKRSRKIFILSTLESTTNFEQRLCR